MGPLNNLLYTLNNLLNYSHRVNSSSLILAVACSRAAPSFGRPQEVVMVLATGGERRPMTPAIPARTYHRGGEIGYFRAVSRCTIVLGYMIQSISVHTHKSSNVIDVL